MTIAGVLPAVPTPFEDGQVSAAALRGNIARWLATDLAGLLVLGTNGEAPLLSERESDLVIATARGQVPADRTLVAGTGRESTVETIVACRRAADLGADAVLVRTPSVFRSAMTADALVGHFRAVADASPTPVILYNFPQLTGVDLNVPAAAALAEHPNIAGMKESSGDVARVEALAAIDPSRFVVVVGAAPAFYPSLCVGAAGGFLAVASVVPDLCVRLWRAARDGRHADALALQRQVTPLAQSVTTTYGIAGLKAALDLSGYVGGDPRPPLTPAPAAAVERIRGQLAALEALV